MKVFEKFEISFKILLEKVDNKDFESISKVENIYNDLGSISNIEMYFNQNRNYFYNLTNQEKIDLIKKLTDLDNEYFQNRNTNWYFANLYNMIFRETYLYLPVDEQKKLLNYILINRKNIRIPFAKDLDLKYNSYSTFNELELKKFKLFQHEWKDK
jgi:hypothetical protein